MNFLAQLFGGAEGSNPMANGLGRLIGADPSRVSDVAGRIGTGMNQIAAAGGAQPGYAAPQRAMPVSQEPMAPGVNNHLQMLDPRVLQAIMQRFQPARQGVPF